MIRKRRRRRLAVGPTNYAVRVGQKKKRKKLNLISKTGHGNIGKLILRENNIKIIYEGLQIYNYIDDTLAYPEYKKEWSVFSKEFEIDRDYQVKEIVSYQELLNLGLKITSRKNTWSKKMHAWYVLVTADSEEIDYGTIPTRHKLEYDTTNKRIRIVGPNAHYRGVGAWTESPLKKNLLLRSDSKLLKKKDYFNEELNEIADLFPEFKKTNKRIPISEIPVMISNEGNLVCLPKSRDEPTWAVVGIRRSGKSYFAHQLLDRVYWQGGKKIGLINDSLRETMTWWRKADTREGLEKLNQKPTGLPMIYLYPHTRSLKGDVYAKNDMGWEISLNADEILDNFNYYLKHKKEWELPGPSISIFRKIKDEIKKCTTISEVEEVLEENVEDKNMRGAILRVIEDMFLEKILDINTNIASKWKVVLPKSSKKEKTKQSKIDADWSETENSSIETETLELNPFSASLAAGLIPSLVTGDVFTKDYFPHIFRYYVSDVFKQQTENKTWRENDFRVWLFCDEITEIASKSDKNVASQILQSVIGKSGPARMSLSWGTQNPSRIEDRIYTNTQYLFVFRFNNTEEANSICSNYNLDKSYASVIKSLDKHEVLACTSEGFIVYDKNGRRFETKDPIRGKGLPCLSMHKAPSSES